jgi:hypothetical protein
MVENRPGAKIWTKSAVFADRSICNKSLQGLPSIRHSQELFNKLRRYSSTTQHGLDFPAANLLISSHMGIQACWCVSPILHYGEGITN